MEVILVLDYPSRCPKLNVIPQNSSYRSGIRQLMSASWVEAWSFETNPSMSCEHLVTPHTFFHRWGLWRPTRRLRKLSSCFEWRLNSVRPIRPRCRGLLVTPHPLYHPAPSRPLSLLLLTHTHRHPATPGRRQVSSRVECSGVGVPAHYSQLKLTKEKYRHLVEHALSCKLKLI